VAYCWLNRFPEALDEFNLALSFDTTNYIIYESRANLYIAMGKYPAALEDLVKFVLDLNAGDGVDVVLECSGQNPPRRWG
jgi:tetratricopeptide (TPR) repeat protein